MIKEIKELLNISYLDGDIDENGYLVLKEESNRNEALMLSKIQLRLHNVHEYACYKFDQKVHIKGTEFETCFPFLSDQKKVRSMCDFIIFYSTIKSPGKINAWVTNLKSSTAGNNISQLKSGSRMSHFILGKMKDLYPKVSIGKINYVLFSTTLIYKSTTNPLKNKSFAPSSGSGSLISPKNFIKGKHPLLEPII